MKQPKSDQDMTCPVCGRSFSRDELNWSEHSGQALCPDCLAEEENCGCSDD